MKLFKFMMAALLALCLTAVSAYSDWTEDFESYEVGTEMVGTVEGWKYFNEYAGTSTVVQDGDSKVLKLSKVEAQEANSYDMVLTPVIRLAPTDPGRQVTKISFKFRPGSGTDLFALYGVQADNTAVRFFYLNFNVNAGTCSSSPGGLNFDNVSKDSYSDCYFLYDALNGKVVEACINGVTNTCNIS